MIAVLLAVAAAACLLIGFLSAVHALGWVALGLAAVAGLLVLLPTSSGIVVEALVEPVDAPEPETPAVPEPPVVELAETPSTDPLPVPQPVEHAETPSTDGLVLVIPGRRRFHQPGCELLTGHDAEKLTEEEAREEEFTPCTRCVN